MYCLDTNIIIDFLKGDSKTVEKIRETEGSLYTTTINLCEIYKGIYKYSKGKRQSQELDEINALLNNISILPLDTESSKEFGKMCGRLKEKGRESPEPNMMIASIAKTNELTLLTKDKEDFKNTGIKLEIL